MSGTARDYVSTADKKHTHQDGPVATTATSNDSNGDGRRHCCRACDATTDRQLPTWPTAIPPIQMVRTLPAQRATAGKYWLTRQGWLTTLGLPDGATQ